MPARGRLLAVLLAMLLAFVAPASAHKASDSYLQVEETPSGLARRLAIALPAPGAAAAPGLAAHGRRPRGGRTAGWPRLVAGETERAMHELHTQASDEPPLKKEAK